MASEGPQRITGKYYGVYLPSYTIYTFAINLSICHIICNLSTVLYSLLMILFLCFKTELQFAIWKICDLWFWEWCKRMWKYVVEIPKVGFNIRPKTFLATGNYLNKVSEHNSNLQVTFSCPQTVPSMTLSLTYLLNLLTYSGRVAKKALVYQM